MIDDYEASKAFTARFTGYVVTPGLRDYLTELAPAVGDDKISKLLGLLDDEFDERDWHAHVDDGVYD